MTSKSRIQEDLEGKVRGQVRFDAIAKQVYSVDASIYEIEPVGIFIPKDNEDLIEAIKICHQHQIPIIARGAATGIAGGCIGKGIIFDVAKNLNKILEINLDEGYVHCEPGVIQDDLNEALAPHGYRLGPDTSTGNRATVGGMLANNAAGSLSLRYGMMVDHILEVELILANGTLVKFGELTKQKWEESLNLHGQIGDISRTVEKIKNEYRDEIIKRYPPLPRRASGYTLNRLIDDETPNIAKLIAGSEGTLGVIASMKLKICEIPRNRLMCVIPYSTMKEALSQVPRILTCSPLSLEMIDQQIISLGRKNPQLQQRLDWLKGTPEALLIVEFDGESSEMSLQAMNRLRELKVGEVIPLFDQQLANDVWTIRKAGLEILLSKRSYQRAVAFIEDVAVPPDRLPDFMEELMPILAELGSTAGIYGHVGAGCIHIRPYLNLRKALDLKKMKEVSLKTAHLVVKYKGAMSGEHGDGLVRSWLHEELFGPKIVKAFSLLRKAFDPEGLMNPGKIDVENGSSKFLKNLRSNPKTPQPHIETFLNFDEEGGFSLAADLCNGNGLCRKKNGIMCPSFQATGDEYDTTRARAQALRAIVNGKVPINNLASPDLLDVLDLCLECKGCRTECPANVDMAKMKSEVLYHYQEKHGYPLRNRLFGNIARHLERAAYFPQLANRALNSALGKKFRKWLKISTHLPVPPIAVERFSSWWKNQKLTSSQPELILFNDTFNEFHHPEIGIKTVKLLQAFGVDFMVSQRICCGRTMISKGLLKEAKQQAQRLVEHLYPFAAKGLPIVGMEPSCILAMADDYKGLLGNDEMLKTVAAACTTLDGWLANNLPQREIAWKKEAQHVLLHGHCHQKALKGMQEMRRVLDTIPHISWEEIPSGCCGMAGSFGYEAEHEEISKKIGELVLFPAIREASEHSIILADGTSCRSQIAFGTDRKALHLAEFLLQRIDL